MTTKKSPGKAKRTSTKPAKVLKESLRTRVKKGFEDKSKNSKSGPILDTDVNQSVMDKQHQRPKKVKRGEI